MSVYVYGLTLEDIKAPGIDASQFSSVTRVTSTNVTEFIKAGAAQLNGVLRAARIVPGEVGSAGTTLDADAHEACREAVINFAVWKIAWIMGMLDTAEIARTVWISELSRYSTSPTSLGDAYQEGISIPIDEQFDSVNVDDWDFTGGSKKW